jgi:aspartyl-tRNA(Asn)/glutamyl-tRNA(Gln) amidotransferase subunit A
MPQAMPGEDVLYLSVRELAERIRARTLSPVELTEAYLERSRTIGAKLNAYVMLTPELARAEARQAEAEIAGGLYRGMLHGIPYAAKDLLAVRGYPTTWGARMFADRKFDYDATVIQKLRDAGAILIGKAAMIELAGGMNYRFASASITGATRNPWNTECWTCGSSSGSGAIAAAGLAGFAIGTETWGSIICPAAFCGASGLRPTFGRVSRHGAMALAFSMDKIGPLGRGADDCGIVLSAIAGHDPADSASLPDGAFSYNDAAPAPLRIGWLTNAWKNPPAAVDAAVNEVRRVMSDAGAQIEPAALPEGPWEVAAGVVVSVEGASAFGDLIDSGKVSQLTDPLGRIGGYVNQQIPASDYVRAQRVRGILQRKIDTLFERFDVLAAASQPVTATPLSTNLETGLDYADPLGGIGNFCGLPSISVPCGFVNGLPVGAQFVGRVYDDLKVIAAARLFQQHTDWHRRRPAVA